MDSSASAASDKERFHAGASKWGKYKKKEKEAKKRKTSKRGFDDQCSEKERIESGSDQDPSINKANFDFPDGGWVCG
jgi:hypothetical protein